MAVVAVNVFNSELSQAQSGQPGQVGQPFSKPQGLKESFCSAVLVAKNRHHLRAHFERLRPNARPKPHQDVFWPVLTDR
jgi:hypothetical protein